MKSHPTRPALADRQMVRVIAELLSGLNEPFIAYNRLTTALGATSIATRLVCGPVTECAGQLRLELSLGGQRVYVGIAPPEVALIHHHGWSPAHVREPVEAVVGSEDLIDALIVLLQMSPLGPRGWCTSHWTVRARASAALAEIQA